MQLPVLTGTIDRRILVNYRVDPEVLARRLPSPFRPLEVRGWGVAGICLIRLKSIRPRGFPRWIGQNSENAAHRVAVAWDTPRGERQGVFVFRRDTSSRLNAWAGGRIFPGRHDRGWFVVDEAHPEYRFALHTLDGKAEIRLDARAADRLPAGSLFSSPAEASGFFERGSIGYSPAARAGEWEGLELRCSGWRAEPLAVADVYSAFFDDRGLFPLGSAEFDHALLMRQIEHCWHRPASPPPSAPPAIRA